MVEWPPSEAKSTRFSRLQVSTVFALSATRADMTSSGKYAPLIDEPGAEHGTASMSAGAANASAPSAPVGEPEPPSYSAVLSAGGAGSSYPAEGMSNGERIGSSIDCEAYTPLWLLIR